MTDDTVAETLESRVMRRTKHIVLGVTLASALAFTGCGPGDKGVQAEKTPQQIDEEAEKTSQQIAEEEEEKTPQQIAEEEKEGGKHRYVNGRPCYVPRVYSESQRYSPEPSYAPHASAPSTPHASAPSTPHASTQTVRGGFHAPHVSTGG